MEDRFLVLESSSLHPPHHPVVRLDFFSAPQEEPVDKKDMGVIPLDARGALERLVVDQSGHQGQGGGW